MTTKILKSIKGKVVRLTRLDACGDVVVGSCTTLVSECFVMVSLSPEIEAGDTYTQKSAWGSLCVNDKDPDITKWMNVKIQFAEINPDALDIIGGLNPVISAGDTIGFTQSTDPNSEAFALEVWTKRTGEACTGSPEWGYFLAPYVRNGRLDGEVMINNGVLTLTVTGQAFPDVGWADGPYAANPFVEDFPLDELYGAVITSVQPPADTAGCIAYAT